MKRIRKVKWLTSCIVVLGITLLFCQNGLTSEKDIVPSISLLLLSHKAVVVSPLAYDPGTIYAQEETSLQVSIALGGSGFPKTLKLFKCSESGVTTEIAATLYDNGDLLIGDDIADDGVYHGMFTLTPPDDTDLFYKVIGGEPARLAVVNNLDNTVIADAQAVATQVKTTYDSTIGTNAQKQAAALTYLTTLGSEIDEMGKAENGFGTWWITKDGLPGLHNPNVDDLNTRSGETVRNRNPELLNSFSESGGPLLPVCDAAKQTITTQGDPGDNLVKSKDALLLRIYDFGHDEIDEIKANLDTLCYNSTLVNLTTTLDHFKNLFQYGVLAVVGHGDTFYKGWLTLWHPEWGSEKGAAQVIINMPVAYNEATMKKDLLAGRLALTPSNNIAIMPAFISYYNTNLPNSLIYIGTCRSGRNTSLSNAFLNDGAGTFFGYTDYVGTTWAENRGINLFNHLTNANTTGTNPENGLTEGGTDPATFVMYGSGTLKITAGLVNGNFEEGTLTGWSPSGDARIITGLGALSPPQGIYMAIISTGLGAVSSSTSILTQKVSPTADKHTLTFRYNVVSEEPLEFVGSIFDDKFGIGINGVVTELETINTSSWIPLGGNYFYGGDDTTFHTGWKTHTIDLSAHIGNCVEIQFMTWDVGDSIYDTVALLDIIELN